MSSTNDCRSFKRSEILLLTSNHIGGSKIRLISRVFPELAVIAQVAQQPKLIVTDIILKQISKI